MRWLHVSKNLRGCNNFVLIFAYKVKKTHDKRMSK